MEQLEKRVEERTKELLLLQKINNLLSGGATPEEILETIVNGMTSVFNYHLAAVYLLDDEKKHLICKNYSIGNELIKKLEEAEKLSGLTALNYKTPLFDGSILSKLVETKEPILTNNIEAVAISHTNDKHLQQLARYIAISSGIRSGIGVPLLVGDKVIGIIGVGSKDQLTTEDVTRLANFAMQVGLAIEKSKLEQELKEYYSLLEKRVEERTRELKLSEQKYRDIIENVSDAIISVSLDGKVLSWNKAAEKIFGWKAEEIIGKDLAILHVDSGEDKTSKIVSEYDSEVTFKTKDGKKFPGYISVRPLYNGIRKLKGLVFVAMDISNIKERSKLEKQLILTEKLASIGLLSAGVAHEINNPLTNISLNAEILLNKKLNDDVAKRKLKEIIVQVEAASKIIKRLLEFPYKSKFEIIDINVKELIEQVLEMHSNQLEKIQVETNFQTALPEIKGDPDQLQEAFSNIILNAVQAMPNGGILHISAKKYDEHIEIDFSDTGVGILEENLPKIFDPFFSTKKVEGGVGLGLYISLGIVERHGGSISVKSKVGVGSTFTVKLPTGGPYS